MKPENYIALGIEAAASKVEERAKNLKVRAIDYKRTAEEIRELNVKEILDGWSNNSEH